MRRISFPTLVILARKYINWKQALFMSERIQTNWIDRMYVGVRIAWYILTDIAIHSDKAELVASSCIRCDPMVILLLGHSKLAFIARQKVCRAVYGSLCAVMSQNMFYILEDIYFLITFFGFSLIWNETKVYMKKWFPYIECEPEFITKNVIISLSSEATVF